MTVKLTGLVYTESTVLSENGQVCMVRCACGQEFAKNRTYILQLRAKGYTLSCWRCKRKVLSEHARRQAEARAIERSKEWAV